MHTILIANEKVTQLFCEYKRLFEPFIKDGSISLCTWNEEGLLIDEALPELSACIGKGHKWRALIIHDPGNFEDEDGNEIFDEYNPYDWAPYFDGFKLEDSKIPLIRLTHLLMGFPDLGVFETVLKSVDERDNKDLTEYSTKEYSEEDLVLHKSLKEKYDVLSNRPCELWLLCMRRKKDSLSKKDISRIWRSRNEFESSLFWQRNNYPEKCRFMCFDFSLRPDELYSRELFEFWCCALTLSLNKIPAGCLQAYRLYEVTCQIDKDLLEQALVKQASGLIQARESVSAAIRAIPVLNAQNNEELLRKQNVPVVFELKEDEDVRIDTDQIGLSKDCPEDESELWVIGSKEARRYLAAYVKEPRRAIDRAAEYTRDAQDRFLDDEYELDKLQLEDMAEDAALLEENILAARTAKLVDLKAYEKELAEAEDKVSDAIAGRMDKKTTIICGAVAICAYLAGFIPYLARAGKDGLPTFAASFLLTMIAAGLLAAFGVGVLFIFRKNVVKAIDGFNTLTKKIIARVNSAAKTFEDYLSLVCTYMKSLSIINGSKKHQEREASYRDLLRMHKNTIDECLDQIGTWQAAFDLKAVSLKDEMPEEFYDFDLLPEDSPLYVFETNREEGNILLKPSGDPLNSPYGFISGISCERLEIFERSTADPEDTEGRPESGREGRI